MGQQQPKFRLRLNLFDVIVVILALAVGVFLLWNAARPAVADPNAPAATTIRYTIRFQKMLEGSSALVQPGDLLEDMVKNYEMGHVVSATSMPASRLILNQQEKRFVMAPIPGYEDADVVVESTATGSDGQLLVGTGYEIKVGAVVYLRGPGYMGSGVITDIERGEGQ